MIRIAPFILCLTICSLTPIAMAEEYISQSSFLTKAFAGEKYSSHTLWLSDEQKVQAEKILGHPYKGLRLRYWKYETTTAWIINEIGKERPIKIGFVIGPTAMSSVSILAYEEPRGYEVRYSFFTDQFVDLQLNAEGELDKSIDGITGATLSVRAVSNSAQLALYLHHQVTAATPLTTDKQQATR